ncbi:hypothetical protein DVA81_18570, partial [Acinetobacter baumannii]
DKFKFRLGTEHIYPVTVGSQGTQGKDPNASRGKLKFPVVFNKLTKPGQAGRRTQGQKPTWNKGSGLV